MIGERLQSPEAPVRKESRVKNTDFKGPKKAKITGIGAQKSVIFWADQLFFYCCDEAFDWPFTADFQSQIYQHFH